MEEVISISSSMLIGDAVWSVASPYRHCNGEPGRLQRAGGAAASNSKQVASKTKRTLDLN